MLAMIGSVAVAKLCVTNIDQAVWHRHEADEIADGASPDLRYCFLVDSSLQASQGLSLGCLILPAGAELPPHSHAPQEAYFIKKGHGLLHLPDGSVRAVRENDAVYIPAGERHGLVNHSDNDLELIWIFPTDSFADVTYHYESRKADAQEGTDA